MAALGLAILAAGTAQAEEPGICADRPAKANAACTVPAGRVQLEIAAVDWSLTSSGGSRQELVSVGGSYVKLGLTDGSDLEIGLSPRTTLTSRGVAGRRASGIGDTVIRYKRRLGGEARVQVALVPFLKLPTASRGLGNGAVEGGLVLPVSFTPAGSVTITLDPEIDILADSAGERRHLALANVVNVSAPVARRVTFSAELWSNLNLEPGGTIEQASADAALAVSVSNDVQLDVGANVGLTSATADFEAYAGVSLRF